jgi:putative transposase
VVNNTHLGLAALVSVRRSCALVGVSKSAFYRHCSSITPFDAGAQGPSNLVTTATAREPFNKLVPAERQAVLDLLHRAEFVDASVDHVWASALDQGIYLCSRATMHRILAEANEAGDRRGQRIHPAKKIPVLVASGPNQVWSWDITKLRGPSKRVFYQLYVVIDIFSRYVVNWILSTVESDDLAQDFLEAAIASQRVQRRQLTIHADRGSSMRSKVVSELLIDLGVTRSHSRPHVSNDNPFSESQFKTMKYCPAFPARFSSLDDAYEFCTRFFAFYNAEHRHLGIALHTPASVHNGTYLEIRDQRQVTLDAAYAAHPARFRNQSPRALEIDQFVWINPPALEEVKA